MYNMSTFKFNGDDVHMGKSDAMRKLCCEKWLKLLRENPECVECEVFQELLILEKRMEKKDDKLKMITIGFPPELTDYYNAEQCMLKFLRHKWIPKNYLYTYEYYGKKSNRFHIHFLAFITKPFKELLKETQNTFKKVCSGNNIDIRCYKDTELTKMIKYVTKNKPKDVEWRALHGFREVYKGGLLSSPVSQPSTEVQH